MHGFSRLPLLINHGITQVDPFKNTTIEIRNIGVAECLQLLSNFFAAIANWAIENDGSIFGQFAEAAGIEIFLTEVVCPLDVTDVKLFLFAGIK